jgi:hypothetical protein
MTLLTTRVKKTIKQVVEKNRIVPKLLVGKLCSLPDFIIIGAMKGGTSSLYHNMCEHPRIAPSMVKEVRYFGSKYHAKSLNWYRAHFPVLLNRQREGSALTGEASPSYIFNPKVAGRIRACVPEVRLIAILRNPVERAYSHYNHFVKIGKENCSFEEAIAREKQEEQNLRTELEKMLGDDRYHSNHYFRYSYLLTRGRYLEQLEVYAKHFPREQMLILKSEDFYEDPAAVLQRVYGFLGLPDRKVDRPKKYMVGKYSGMNPATREYLSDYYRPHNEQLYQFLGTDMGWEQQGL